MHRTEGPDYQDVGGKRRHKETYPATVVNKDIMNALQEEICLAVENSGQTLRSTGAIDETVGWGQLDKAILRRAIVNVVSYGADPTGVSDSTQAFNNAFAASSLVYVPEGTFKISATITIPDGGMLLGSGKGSQLLSYVTSLTMLSISNTSASIKDIYLSGNSYASVSLINISVNSASHRVLLKNIWLNDYLTGIKMIASSDNVGLVVLDTIYGTNIDAGGTFIAAPQLTGESCPRIIASKLHEVDFASGDNAILFYGSSSAGERLFSNCNFVGGKINIISTSGMIIQNSFLDMDSYSFNGTDSIRFIKNTIGSAKSNTVNNDVTNPSRAFWEDNRQENGKINGSANINGIKAKRRRSGTAQTILGDGGGAVVIDYIDFNEELLRKMANHSSYTKDDPWNGSDAFVVKGYGNGYVTLEVDIRMQCVTSTQTDQAEVNLFVTLDTVRVLRLAKVIESIHATTGKMFFTGTITLPVEVTEEVAIQVENNQIGNIYVLQDVSIINIEGL